MGVQNNFNSKNRGNFADREINNEPPKPREDTMLTSQINQDGRPTKGNSTFNSKAINS